MIRLLITAFLLYETSLIAAPKVIHGYWSKSKDEKHLEIPFLNHLPSNYLEIIQSGFSTFTRIKISFPLQGNHFHSTSIDCSVLYDTWEEKYDIIQLSPFHQVRSAKNIQNYAKGCLAVKFPNTQFIRDLILKKTKIPASIRVEQISQKQLQNIKGWLVQQQSPLIQNLFSHMLGQLKVEDEIRFIVDLGLTYELK